MSRPSLSPEAIELWQRSINWLNTVQEQQPGPDQGGVRNPISGICGERDAASAALAFAYQWRRSGQDEWAKRATAAFDFAIKRSGRHGFHEEIRNDDTGEWYLVENSMFATGSAVESLYGAVDFGVDRKIDPTWAQSICEAVMDLTFGDKGAIAHDSRSVTEREPRDVQNTTLFGGFTLLWLGGLLPSSDDRERYLAAGRKAVEHGIEGQLADGFWCYLYGDGPKDGDQTHHTYCLGTLAQIAELLPGQFDGMEDALKKGCDWFVRECIVKYPVARIRWEWAKPHVVRRENHFDTCAYFNGAAALTRCARLLGNGEIWMRAAADLLHGAAVRLSIVEPSDEGTILPLDVPPELRPKKSASAPGDGWVLSHPQRRITTELYLPWKLAMFARALKEFEFPSAE